MKSISHFDLNHHLNYKRNTCNANSLVGLNIKALAPTMLECFSNLLINGIKNAAVFPLPVLEHATMSRPSNARGITFLWIGVGRLKPFVFMALKTDGLRFMD